MELVPLVGKAPFPLQFPFCESSSAGLETTDVDPFADFAEYGHKGQRL